MTPEQIEALIARLEHEGSDAFHKHYSLGMWNLCAEAASALRFLLEERVALKADYAEAIEITRAFHSRVKIDGTSLRLGAPSPNSIMGRAAAILAKSPPQRQGDRPELPNDLRSRETKTSGENP